MAEQELIDYIKNTKNQGFSDEKIRKALLDAGWKEEDIEEGFRAFVQIKPKKPQPKWLVPVIVMIGIVILGLIAWGGYYLLKPAPSEELAEKEPSKEREEEELSEEEAIIEEVEEIKDCGSVINTHIFLTPQDLTNQERNSLKCINDAFVNCSLAKLELVEEELPEGMPVIGESTGGIYEIKGKENQKCLVSQEVLKPPSYKTCKIPIDFIAANKVVADQQGQSDFLFVIMAPMAFTPGEISDVRTGEKIDFECE